MPYEINTLSAPLAYIVKVTEETSLELFEVNVESQAVTSSVLPVEFTNYLTARLRGITASAVISEDAFSGLVRSLVSVRQYEDGSPTLADPAHVFVGVQMSTSSPFNPQRKGQSGASGGAEDLLSLTLDGGVVTASLAAGGPPPTEGFWADWIAHGSIAASRNNPGGASFGGGIHAVIGGVPPGVIGTPLPVDMILFDNDLSTVVPLPPYPHPRAVLYPVCTPITVGNEIMMMGGRLTATTGEPSLPAEIIATCAYVDLGGTWTATADLNEPGIWFPPVRLNTGEPLRIGGVNDIGITAVTEIWEAGVWNLRTPMPDGRMLHSGTVLLDGRVLVAGGNSSSGGAAANIVASTYLYNAEVDTWDVAADMNVARMYHAATLLENGRVMVAGGVGIDGEVLTSVEIYNPADNTWTEVADLLTPRYRIDYFNGGLYVDGLGDGNYVGIAGGATGPGAFQGNLSAERYNQLTDTWETTEAELATRHIFGVAYRSFTDNGAIYYGGNDGSQVNRTAYTP